MIKRLTKRAFFIIVPFIMVAVPLATFYFYLITPVHYSPTSIEVKKGATLSSVAKQLQDAGVIRFHKLFSLYGRFSGKDNSLKTGEYEFKNERTPFRVFAKLVEGRVTLHKLTMVEGWSLDDFASHLEKSPFLKTPNIKADFLKLAQDKNFISSLGLKMPADVESLEGYLFPETYLLSSLIDARTLLSRMVNEWKKQASGELLEQSQKYRFSSHQWMTLASIIEKEAGSVDEMPLVSSVFHNRLKKGMLLESDPTIIYGLKNFDGNIRQKDIHNPHKYNTYVHLGLPPGPIANPGRMAMMAAVYPAESKYFYFVSRNDGTSQFSATLRDHINAVNKYQRRR